MQHKLWEATEDLLVKKGFLSKYGWGKDKTNWSIYTLKFKLVEVLVPSMNKDKLKIDVQDLLHYYCVIGPYLVIQNSSISNAAIRSLLPTDDYPIYRPLD